MNHPINTVFSSKPNQAESLLDLSDYGSFLLNRHLVITTRKADHGRLNTTALVRLATEYGYTFNFSFSGDADSDFHRRLVSTPCRATDKAVRHQHHQVLVGLDDLVAQAMRHYNAQRNQGPAPSLGADSSSGQPERAA